MNDENLIKNPSIDRWLWLLKRTVQSNNWRDLHESFTTDNSYFRELVDIMDYVKDEANKVPLNHKVITSMNSGMGTLFKLRELFAVDCYKRGEANESDVSLVIEMINRTIWSKEYNEELMNLIKDSFNKRKTDPLVNNLDQAFQLERTNIGGPLNPYKVPNNIKQLITMMIDQDKSWSDCILEIDKLANNHLDKTKDNKGLWLTAKDNPRPSIWGIDRWQDEMDKYKWTGLNDYLYDRMEKGRIILDDRERKRIKSNWNKIDMPLSLMCYSTFVTVKIGKLNKAKSETIKAKDLH
jgi:hypothetical protein